MLDGHEHQNLSNEVDVHEVVPSFEDEHRLSAVIPSNQHHLRNLGSPTYGNRSAKQMKTATTRRSTGNVKQANGAIRQAGNAVRHRTGNIPLAKGAKRQVSHAVV